MDHPENYCDKLNNKLQSDQSKLKDKQQELCKLTGDLQSVEETWKERKRLHSQINEKTKSIELLLQRVKANFDEFPRQIDDLDAYAKQALQNKHKFEVPIDEFQQSLDTTLTKLNDQINEKINAIKSRYQTIIDKLRAKKEHLEQRTTESSNEYEQLQEQLSIGNQNIARLEEEIAKKQNQIEEITAEIARNVELGKQLELKKQSTLKVNQSRIQEIANLNAQFKKADEDKKSIESKIRMQDELIDCTRLMIQELESNLNSNVNSELKSEYDRLDEQVRLLQSEYDDRVRIHQMKAQSKALRERKVEQINRVLQTLRSVETDGQLSDVERETQYASIIGEIQNEIRTLESEVEAKGLLGQLNMTQQVTQSKLGTQAATQSATQSVAQKATQSVAQKATQAGVQKATQSHPVEQQTQQTEAAGDQLKESIDPPKANSNQFELVPEELQGYLYDTKIILFNSQDEEDNEPSVENRSNETSKPVSAAEMDSVLRSIENVAENCMFSYGLDEFTNPIIPEIFTSSERQSASNVQSESTQIDVRSSRSTQQSADPNKSISSQVSQTSTLANQIGSFSTGPFSTFQSKDSCFKTPEQQNRTETTDASKRKKHSDSNDKTKRKRY